MARSMGRAGAIGVIALLMSGVAWAAPHPLHYLTDDDIAPAGVLPPPPAPGSAEEKAELAALHAIVSAAPPERLAQAQWDQDHEDPGLFDRTLGVTLEKLPLTWSVLTDVSAEAAAAATINKAYFHRTRPWGIDPTLPSCEHAPEHKPTNSYPSGHAMLGYSTGFVLARLLPGRAPEILARAADYGYSREVCGVHFRSDIAASQTLGTLVALKLLANPAFRVKVDAARQELIRAHIPGA